MHSHDERDIPNYAHRALWVGTLPLFHRFSVGNFPQERDLTRQIGATELVGATSTRGHSNALSGLARYLSDAKGGS